MRPTSINITDTSTDHSYSVAGNTYRIIVSGEQTNNAYAIIDMLVPPGGGPGPHAHKDIEESFYVLEGSVVFRSETQLYKAVKGDYVNIPLGGAVHSFKNESEGMARLLCTVAPAGLDAFFKEIGRPVAHGEFLPPVKPDEQAMQRLKDLFTQYGQEMFPPDFFDK
jgi:quercetin dioxygenase-like cupin family protein